MEQLQPHKLSTINIEIRKTKQTSECDKHTCRGNSNIHSHSKTQNEQLSKLDVVKSELSFNIETLNAKFEGSKVQISDKSKEIQDAASTIFDLREEISGLKRKLTAEETKTSSLTFQCQTKSETIDSLYLEITDLKKKYESELFTINK